MSAKKWYKKRDESDVPKIQNFGQMRPSNSASPSPKERRIVELNTEFWADSDRKARGTNYDSYALNVTPDPLSIYSEDSLNSEYARYEKAIELDWVKKVDLSAENQQGNEYWFEAYEYEEQYWKVRRSIGTFYLNILGKVTYNVLCGGVIRITSDMIQTNAPKLVWKQKQGSRTLAIALPEDGSGFPVDFTLQGSCIPGTGCTGTQGEPIIVWVYPEGREEYFQSFFFYTVPTSLTSPNEGLIKGGTGIDQQEIVNFYILPLTPNISKGYVILGMSEVTGYIPPWNPLAPASLLRIGVSPASAYAGNQYVSLASPFTSPIVFAYQWLENVTGSYEPISGLLPLAENNIIGSPGHWYRVKSYRRTVTTSTNIYNDAQQIESVSQTIFLPASTSQLLQLHSYDPCTLGTIRQGNNSYLSYILSSLRKTAIDSFNASNSIKQGVNGYAQYVLISLKKQVAEDFSPVGVIRQGRNSYQVYILSGSIIG